MTPLARITAALGGLVLLTACSTAGGTTVITNEYRASTYTPNVLNYPAGKGGLYTEIVGRPFGAPERDLVDKTLATFERAHFGNKVALTTDPAQVEKSGGYRLVALFDPAIDVNYGNVCAGSRKRQDQPEHGVTTMLLTYCLGSKVITSVKARHSGGIETVDDPAFETFLGQASAALFPPRREENNDREGWNS